MSGAPLIALATCERLPELDEDDAPLVRALADRGFTTRPLIWTDPEPEGPVPAAVVLRSTWDWHLCPAEFRRWIDDLERRGVNLWNPAHVLRWNLDKAGYLADLEQRGVRLVPTARLEAGGTHDLPALLAERGWDHAVVKPAESADGYRTQRVRSAEPRAGIELLSEITRTGTALVQPYREEIEREGEWSFLYFGGELSHVTLKRPARGEFRVQDTYGGTRETVDDPPASLLADAHRAHEAAGGQDLLYVRVDGVRTEAGLEVMEVELVEPSLYFDGHLDRGERFAAALAARL